jgi:hypothetical protein
VKTSVLVVIFSWLISRALRELRELIKDLWYRNEEERTAAKLKNKLLRRQIEKYYPAARNKDLSKGIVVSELPRKKRA